MVEDSSNQFAVVVPMRLHSTRLRLKMLQDIAGRTLASRTITIAANVATKLNAQLYIAVADQPLIDIARRESRANILARPDLADQDEGPTRFRSWQVRLKQHQCIVHLNACFPFLRPELVIAAANQYSGTPRLPTTIESTPIWTLDRRLAKIVAPGVTRPYHRFTHQWMIISPNCYSHLNTHVWQAQTLPEFDTQPPGLHLHDINTQADLDFARLAAAAPTKAIDAMCP